MTKTLLVTGSSGLIGSEVCVYFAAQGYTIHGVDNNQRAVFPLSLSTRPRSPRTIAPPPFPSTISTPTPSAR